MITPETTIPWPAVRDGWLGLPRASRYNYVLAAATCLHDLWRNRADLTDVTLDDFSFRTNVGPVTAQLSSVHIRRLDRPMPQSHILAIFARWQENSTPPLDARDFISFLRAFASIDTADRASIRFACRRVADNLGRRRHSRADTLYAAHLADGATARWAPDPALPAAELVQAVQESEQRDDAHLIKSGHSIRVIRSVMLGQDVLIKRYDLNKFRDRIKYRFRASRARRAWAAANTLLELGIPTPRPLGFVEIKDDGLVKTSYVITQFLPEVTSVYRWLKVNYRRQGEEWRRAFRTDLLASLLSLYRAGLYHSDTKLPNLLVRNADDRSKREFLWTDLECVVAGKKPSRHQIIRNLVQMNGSVRYWVPEADRLAFLRALAQYFPWVSNPAVTARIRRWTRRRLLRELHRHTSPDGLLSRR